MHEYNYTVEIPCPACIDTVKRAFLSCKDKITKGSMSVTLHEDQACIRLSSINVDEKEARKILRESVDDIGFECQELEAAQVKRKNTENHILKGLIGLLFGAGLMGLCLSGVGIPAAVTIALAALSTLLTLYLGKKIFIRAARNIENLVTRREKSLSMDVLLTLSSLIAVGISIGSIFVPWLPMMFDTALLILGFTHLGKALKISQSRNAEKKISFLSRDDSTVAVINEKTPKMKIAELKRGQTIRVYAGQTIPVDGKCRSESAAVCKIIDNGKNASYPVKKDEDLQAGWQVPQGVPYIDIQVEKEEAQSTLARMNKKYKLAQAEKNEKRKKPPFERLTDIMTNYFVPTMLAIAVISAVVIGTLFSPLSAAQAILSIVATACPCTLGLIIPLAIKTAIIKAAADGIRVKTEESFQFLHNANTIIFDWRGTLTTGEAQVAHTNLRGQDLDYLAALEGQSSHHFASAICEHIKKTRGLARHLKVSAAEPHHSGLMASIFKGEEKEIPAFAGMTSGEKYLTGNKAYLASLGIDTSTYEKDHQLESEKKRYQAQYATYFVHRNAQGEYQIRGHVLLKDPLRPDAREVIRKLKQQGYKVGIFSGSNDECLSHFAQQENLDYFQANCLGSSKSSMEKSKEALMAELKRQGRQTIMVGDSANDVFAMMKSDFSIAVKSKDAHGLTLQSADAILDPKTSPDPNKPLHPILSLLSLSKKTVRSVKTNLAINLTYNVVSSVLFTGLVVAGFAVNPGIGVALMVLQSAFLFWNLKRMIQQKAPYANDPVMPPQKNIQKMTYLPSAKPKPQAQNQLVDSPAQKTRLFFTKDAKHQTLSAAQPSQPSYPPGVLRW